MRIGILTLPLHENYGGILQAYALQKVLKDMGHDTLVFDKTRTVELPMFTRYILYCIKYIKNILQGKHNVIKWDKEYNKKLEIKREFTYPFIKKHIKRIELKGTYSTLLKGDYDAIIVGSDQVWRPMFFYLEPLENAYLSFAKDWDIKRISYAASFGTDEWEYSSEQTEKCSALLQRFDAVSVRESSAVSLCKEHFGVDAYHVLDPTMLLDADDYISLFQEVKTPVSDGDLMYYFLDASEQKSAIVRSVAEICHLTPFTVNHKNENLDVPLEENVQPPVEKWLRGFYDTKYIVTDSFHACVFSILFNKPFIVYGNKFRGMARFHSLLKMFGLYNRLVTTPEEALEVIYQPIDWGQVNKSLAEWRVKSLKFLTSALTTNC